MKLLFYVMVQFNTGNNQEWNSPNLIFKYIID